MGARGPAPKPVELRVLEGNRGNRPLDLSSTFRPETAEPTMPTWLTAEAKRAWALLAPELLRYNLLAAVDQPAFAMLCQTIGRIEQVERAIAERQATARREKRPAADALQDVTPNGLRVQSALYQILNREQAKLHSMLAGFGLRPDARARVTAGVRAQLQLFEQPAPAAAGASPAPDALPDRFDQF